MHVGREMNETKKKKKKKPKALVVGGSIALLAAGSWWCSRKPLPPLPAVQLVLDLNPNSFSQLLIQSWIRHPHLLRNATLPLTIDQAAIFAISHSCSGVAARAYSLIVEILKDRPSWFRDCQSLDVFALIPSGKGRTTEHAYTQVCGRSLCSGAGPSAAAASQFVRGEMLPRGYSAM